ncbi:MAG: hypothetical protein HND48_06840 [Chloroflexi bacterium]|nr:hypothetical protein [Chloroflexota bacterium]
MRRSLCVHTRLIDEVPEFRMQQSLRAVREMGAGTIVEFFPWAYVERRPGQDDWSQPDKIFKHARNQGIRVIARLGLVPEWARQREDGTPTTFNELPAESYDNFAAYAARFTARYRDDLAAIIVWNEPNLTFEWGFRPVSPVEHGAAGGHYHSGACRGARRDDPRRRAGRDTGTCWQRQRLRGHLVSARHTGRRRCGVLRRACRAQLRPAIRRARRASS